MKLDAEKLKAHLNHQIDYDHKMSLKENISPDQLCVITGRLAARNEILSLVNRGVFNKKHFWSRK